MLKGILYSLVIVTLLTFLVWWEQYHYRECRKVHPKLYCILDAGR